MEPVVSMSWISLGATVQGACLAPTVKSTSMNVHRIPARIMVPVVRASTGSNVTVQEALLAPSVKLTSMNVLQIHARIMVPAVRELTGLTVIVSRDLMEPFVTTT